MICNLFHEPKKKGGMRYVKRKKIINHSNNGRFGRFISHTGICKVDQSERGWDCFMDLYHYWSSDRPSSIDTSIGTLLLFYRDSFKLGLKTEEGYRRGGS
jgi:hypothetical protein